MAEMATTSSSDGSCAAPADFQLSSDLEDVSNRLSIALLKCPLCHNSRKVFYCKQCIQNGDFIHSTSVYSERFADKQLRLLRLKTARNQLQEKCNKALEKHMQRDKLVCDISTCKERVRLLQASVIETKQSIHKGSQRLSVLKDVNSQLILNIPKYEQRIEKVQQYVNRSKIQQNRHKEELEKKRQLLKKVVRTFSKQLVQYIFPICQINSYAPVNEGGIENSDVVTSALADASGTSYVRGKWINDNENSLKVYHRIVASTLPGTGDYSAYSLWLAQNRESMTIGNKENSVPNNPTYNISAALTYATQLVNIIAFYLNVRLPYKLEYSDFSTSEISEHKFARKVARLNCNVLHLCFTQNTDVSVLHPMHTLQNLMHLLNTEISDLGRIGPIEVDPNIMAQMHKALIPDLENSDDSASDEETDAFNWEWEAVPNVACPEMAVPVPGSSTTQQSSSVNINQSVAGNLVTSAAASIASMWRGFITNK